MNCRICGSSSVTAAGVVEYIIGYAWDVYDCETCGCRFTRHDDSVYDRLHTSGAIPYYQDYRQLAAESKVFFDRRDLAGLRGLLAGATKYRFVMDEVDRQGPDARLLEIGCSRGYLTSYFISTGRDILGVDVSADAVEAARGYFGDHFAMAGSARIRSGAPYDIIYHVGMIGCVADPVGFTRDLLAMLKPGGKLIFNAPNREACVMRDQLWFDSAPPPDLVTLFPPGFWASKLADSVEVREGIELADSTQSFVQSLRRPLGRSWTPPVPRSMFPDSRDSTSGKPNPRRSWALLERGLSKVGRTTGLHGLLPRQPTEFGLYVKLKSQQ